MNESLKVQPHHLERAAYLYVRQSSMRQVIENIESNPACATSVEFKKLSADYINWS